jgi:hypothetical protein
MVMTAGLTILTFGSSVMVIVFTAPLTCVSIRQHTSAYVSIRQHTFGSSVMVIVFIAPLTCVSIRQHTTAYVSVRQHTFGAALW